MRAKVTLPKIHSVKPAGIPTKNATSSCTRPCVGTSVQFANANTIISTLNIPYFQKRTLFSEPTKNKLNQSIKQLLNEQDKRLIADCIEMGIQYDQQRRYDEALKMFDQALLLEPSNVDTNFCKGITLSKMNKFPEAIDSFKASMNSNSTSNLQKCQALLNIGFCFSQLTMYDDALQFYNEALKMDPKNISVLVQKGISQIRLKEYQEAINTFDSVLAENSNNVKAIFNKGVAYGGLGKHEEALKCYEEVISLDSNFTVQAWFNKGAALGLLYRFEEAVIAFDEVLKLDKDNAGAYLNKGTFLIELNRGEEATKCFEQATNLDPSLASPYKKNQDS